jgi:hypothetical protein
MEIDLKKSVFRHVEDGIGERAEINMPMLTFSTAQMTKLIDKLE